jgi:phage terminase large subunit-like protein
MVGSKRDDERRKVQEVSPPLTPVQHEFLIRMARTGRKTDPIDASPGPWEAGRGSYHGQVIRFIERYCVIPKGHGHGRPLQLASWQKEQIEAIYAPGIDAAVLSFPRGNGKSTLEAALAVAAGFMGNGTGSPSVPIIATTVGQAIRSVYGTVNAMVAKSPELRTRSIPYSGMGHTRIVIPRNGGEIFPMANLEGQIQGLDPTLAIADEIGFQPMSAWGGLVQAGGKRERSLILGMGTPGVDHDNALYAIRESLLAGPLPRFHFREWAAEEGASLDDRRQWRAANPAIKAGFLRESALETDLHLMPAARFRIFRLGLWVEGFESWLGEDGGALWRETEDDYHMVPGAPTWVGVDAAITRDTTAVVIVQERPDGRLHAQAKFWQPTRDEPTDISEVMAYIRILADTYRLGSVAFDPRFLDWPAKVLGDEGVPMVEVSQGVDRMTSVVGDLYTIIREKGVTHPRDPLFAQHVLSAQARHNERGFTLKKDRDYRHIDGVIALSLAVSMYRGRKKARPELFVG